MIIFLHYYYERRRSVKYLSNHKSTFASNKSLYLSAFLVGESENFKSYMNVNENHLTLLNMLRVELVDLKKEDQIDKLALISLLEQVQQLVECIVCNDEAARMLCRSMLGTIAITRKWADDGDVQFALSSTAIGLSYFLMKKDVLK